MASETDPLGLVSSPPSTIVKIINTAREDMNGQLGIVVQFQQDRGRYLVHLTQTQNVVAMKPDNLIKAGYMDQAQAYYQQATQSPEIQNMLAQVTAKLPAGVSLKHAGMGVAGLFLALIYFLGFSRTLMLVSFVMMVMMVVGQDLMAGADYKTVVRNAPIRFQTMVREQFPGGSYIAGKPYEKYVLMGLGAALIVFFVKSMMPVSSNAAAGAGATTNNNMPQPSRNLMTTQKMAEEYYKLGFDDATAEKEFGSSLPDLSASTEATSEAYDAVMDDLPDYGPPPTRSQGGIMGKIFSMSSAMSMMYLGRTAMDLGKDAGGGWSFALFKANLVTLEPWKLGLLGLSLYRLVSAVIF